MCLDTITEQYDPPCTKIRKGWKVVRPTSENKWAPCIVLDEEHPFDQWCEAKQLKLDGFPYLTGWHIWLDKGVAHCYKKLNEIVQPVLFTKTTTIGSQDIGWGYHGKVAVAQKIKVLWKENDGSKKTEKIVFKRIEGLGGWANYVLLKSLENLTSIQVNRRVGGHWTKIKIEVGDTLPLAEVDSVKQAYTQAEVEIVK